jgi:hypothetical protein
VSADELFEVPHGESAGHFSRRHPAQTVGHGVEPQGIADQKRVLVVTPHLAGVGKTKAGDYLCHSKTPRALTRNLFDHGFFGNRARKVSLARALQNYRCLI